jgi:hypothetical protein
MREPALAAVGYTPVSRRAAESATLAHTAHYFLRTVEMNATLYQTWACTRCGHERIYGAEEV